MKKLISISLFSLAVAFAPIGTSYAHENDKPMASSTQASKTPFDIQFLDTMSQHHRDGVKMMQMAVDKAQSQDVKDMAQRMMDDQEKEIDQMKSMRDEIKPDAPNAVNMKMPGMMKMDMSKLQSASGMAFDRQFLMMMTKHHEGAVKMSDAALKQAQNADVKAMAQKMHDKQKSEIADMQAMLKDMGK